MAFFCLSTLEYERCVNLDSRKIKKTLNYEGIKLS